MSSHAALTAFLVRVTRRLRIIGALYGAAAGILGGSLVVLILDPPAVDVRVALLIGGIAGIVGGAAIGALLTRRIIAAHEVERRAPGCRNVILTASELMAAPEMTKPYVAEVVTAEAARTATTLDVRALFPATRALGAIVAGGALWLSTMALIAPGVPASPLSVIRSASGPGDGARVEVTMTPPAYTGGRPQRLVNPGRVEAMAGSLIRLEVRGDSVRAETIEGQLAPLAGAKNVFELRAAADGYIAIASAGTSRRLIGLSVTPDQVPRVKVTAPGKDMFLPDARRTIPVAIEASDDLALASLKLRYTKVSGSGERFTFVEGEVPITVERANGREWKARGTLDLPALKLEQGDMIVYRGAATDRRPGAIASESDAFIIEITSPGMIAAEGFSLDDEQDKYALSQQMVILKTERLLARAATMSPESLTYHSQMLAAEQRSVRAEFVFMMGGEVAEEVIAAAGMDINEEAEAANESELAAGRMVNRGRVALVEAIRLMSRASAKLNEGDPRSALPEEKRALVSLQEAFSRTRYLLRALTRRERLDLSRRLTGVLELAARDTRPQAVPPVNAATDELRKILADVASLAGSSGTGSDIAGLAQRVIRVDPSDTTLQRAASRLEAAAGEVHARGMTADARSALDDAATILADALRLRLPRDIAPVESPALRRLRGALGDAMRQRSGAR
jgi:hypothetical protein